MSIAPLQMDNESSQAELVLEVFHYYMTQSLCPHSSLPLGWKFVNTLCFHIFHF